MDELEFRRRAYSDPNQDDNEFVAAMGDAPGRAEFVTQLQGMDRELEKALKVPVPDDLAERLLLKQNMTVHRDQKRRHRWQMAAAASVAFAIGLSLAVFNQGTGDLGQHALAHVAHEAGFTSYVDEQVDLRALNTKLASFGGQFSELPGQVYYANYCDFEGIRSLHIVMSSDQGRVTLFVIPKQNEMTLPPQFADKRYHGIGEDRAGVHLAVVGDKGQPLEPVLKRVEAGYQPL
ncbi:DUF3379 domain-containing protein [Ferrimonas balearica]|uniref:DUF3379 domain-containing protein n=1 Tax=Ferrimonas balearica TaxID=44012 RepID=UPI001C9479E1|nr:DUF3379 domain-containing protein [Ferrimonas balearica]MBY5979943.1 DUF3379 domain-containing protein [Ferrimonas balearica]